MPIVFALLTAFFFAMAALSAQRGLHLQATPWGVWITLIINCAFLWTAHLWLEPDAPLWIRANLLFVLIGLFVPGVARMLVFRGIRKIGSSITSTIEGSSPMFSTVLAMTFLGEQPTPVVLSGIALIVAGLMTLSWTSERRSWKRIELLYPLLASFLFAVKDVLARWGLVMTGFPVLGAAIAALTATIEVFLIVRFVQNGPFSAPRRDALFWFLISGLFTGASFLCMFSALHLERVSIVAPIVNNHMVFIVLLAPLINRGIELVSPRKILGAALVVLGIFLVSFGRQ
jgi:uncharacterized membrane protein